MDEMRKFCISVRNPHAESSEQAIELSVDYKISLSRKTCLRLEKFGAYPQQLPHKRSVFNVTRRKPDKVLIQAKILSHNRHVVHPFAEKLA